MFPRSGRPRVLIERTATRRIADSAFRSDRTPRVRAWRSRQPAARDLLRRWHDRARAAAGRCLPGGHPGRRPARPRQQLRHRHGCGSRGGHPGCRLDRVCRAPWPSLHRLHAGGGRACGRRVRRAGGPWGVRAPAARAVRAAGGRGARARPDVDPQQRPDVGGGPARAPQTRRARVRRRGGARPRRRSDRRGSRHTPRRRARDRWRQPGLGPARPRGAPAA